MKVMLNIQGMSCEHCVARVEEALLSLDGVKKVKVNLKKKQAKVKVDERVASPTDLVLKVQEIGFEAEVQ